MDFVSKNVSKEDRILFGFDDDDLVEFDPENFSMADIAVHLGLFPSKTQAGKNGWCKDPLPLGMGSKYVKNKKVRREVFWLNDLPNMDDIID